MKHPLFVLCGLLLCFAAACGTSEGANVHPPGDADLRSQDGTFKPDGAPSVDLGTEGRLEDVPEYDFWGGDTGYDWGPPDKDFNVSPDGQGNFCSKDFDCVDALVELAPCQRAVCNKHIGECVPGPRSPGEPCDDSDECTLETVCTVDGLCLGNPTACDDGNLCTTDSCKADKGCVFVPNDNVCDDGNSCTKSDRCDANSCIGEVSEECTCGSDSDCEEFDDGNFCNGTVQCVFDVCKVPKSSVVVCPDLGENPCVKNLCESDTGNCIQVVRENGRPCDDSDACTVGDLCKQGICVGSAPLSCDDGNSCTVDSCSPVTGCLSEFSLYPCDDGDGCTVNDHCKEGVCLPGASNQCNAKTCFPKWTMSCGGSDFWDTAGDGSTDNVSVYSCTSDKLSGPEYTSSFVAPFDGVATIAMTTEDIETRLLLLEAKGTGCDGSNCRLASPGVLSFDMFAGQVYYFVVDSPIEEGVSYGLTLDCVPHSEAQCDDGEDNDEDGLFDCEDVDCVGSGACPEPKCEPVWTIGCGVTDFGTNYGIGGTDAIVNYHSIPENKGCLDNQWDYTGPEFAYRFDAPGDFNVTVRLLGESAQTDLLILQDQGGGCDPTDCIAWGLKKVTFPAKAGESYYFVIDGYALAQGAFAIEVECPAYVETQCHDGLDNDLDVLTDCEDPDCYGAVACVGYCKPAKTVGCGFAEAFANFGWGSTDAVEEYECAQWVYNGPEMAYRFKAPFDTEVNVSLALENASTDILVVEGFLCDPSHCIAHGLDHVDFEAKEGKEYNIIVDGYQGALGTYKMDIGCTSASELVCDDGLDDDDDGLVDCADEVDCAGEIACAKCKALYPIECGDTDEWTTASPDVTDVVAHYSCTPGQYDGPEFAYTFEPTVDGPVTLMLDSTLWDLDLFVLNDNGHGCNPTSCLAWGTNQVLFDGVAGSKYFVVVDGYGKAPSQFGPNYGIGDYILTVTCP
jgi:hypothetical protein